MIKTKGVLIIAGGDPYYGMCATNLCASIRYKDKTTPITVLHDGKAINEKARLLLTGKLSVSLQQMDESTYMVDGKPNFYRVKTLLNKLTPFDVTLYLDADTMWLGVHSVAEFLEDLDSVPFAMINEGWIDLQSKTSRLSNFYTFWKDMDDIVREYGSRIKGGKLYQLRSEMMLFEKTDETEAFFRRALRVYDSAKTNCERVAIDKIPDEFAFNIASAITGLYPHKDQWNPMFWEFKHKAVTKRPPPSEYEILHSYYAYSIGGMHLSDSQKKFYDSKIKAYYYQQALGRPVPIMSKKDVLPERKKL